MHSNLAERKDQLHKLVEAFYYDDLNRLDYSTLEMPGKVGPFINLDLTYDEAGNITSKSGVGNYHYDSTRPHALTRLDRYGGGTDEFHYDANGNLLSDGTRSVTWSSYNYPLEVTQGPVSTHFAYGPNRQRYREEQWEGGALQRRSTAIGQYFEKVEEDGVVTYKHYIRAGTKVVAVHDRTAIGQVSTHYLLRDHLGSVSAIADEEGDVIRMSFDAFGQRRGSPESVTPWQRVIDPADLAEIRDITTRGYTGHQMVDSVGLIHMGGRIYDPELGRFLSPDPNIPEPGNAQAYNRYSYVYNNPLSFTDPSGFVAQAPTECSGSGQECTEPPSNRAAQEMEECKRKGIECVYEDDGQGQPRAVPASEVSNAVNGSQLPLNQSEDSRLGLIRGMSFEELVQLSEQLATLLDTLKEMDKKSFRIFAPELDDESGEVIRGYQLGLMLDTSQLALQVDMEITARKVNAIIAIGADLAASRGAKTISMLLYKAYKHTATYLNAWDSVNSQQTRSINVVPNPVEMRTDIYIREEDLY